MDCGRKDEQIPTELILAWLNMCTYITLCAAHARRTDDVPLDEYYKKLLIK